MGVTGQSKGKGGGGGEAVVVLWVEQQVGHTEHFQAPDTHVLT